LCERVGTLFGSTPLRWRRTRIYGRSTRRSAFPFKSRRPTLGNSIAIHSGLVSDIQPGTFETRSRSSILRKVPSLPMSSWVSYKISGTRIVVIPVALAEKLCALHCDYWYNVPTGTATAKRSHSFPIYLSFAAKRESHQAHDDRVQRNILKFENRWDILSMPISVLNDPKKWPLIS
jgi:hypothetical protein